MARIKAVHKRQPRPYKGKAFIKSAVYNDQGSGSRRSARKRTRDDRRVRFG